MSQICTLLTDFGEKDSYVAAMKGVLLSRAPALSLVDLSHEISPQDIFQGSYFWWGAIPSVSYTHLTLPTIYSV